MTEKNQLENKNDEKCPVGIVDCQWVAELSTLRQENESLHNLVSTDPLTGLFNFRYFQQVMDAEMQRTFRSGRPTSLIMIDIDFFKAVNDEWGHEAGNIALQTAATVFKRELRQFDIICRYGGEEFVIILPQTPLPLAVRIAERVRASLQNEDVILQSNSINITASFGINVFQSGSDMSREALVESADQFLYQAKEQGRNRVAYPDYTSVKSETAVSTDEKSALFGDN